MPANEIDITDGRWCEQCYCYHITESALIGVLSSIGYELTEAKEDILTPAEWFASLAEEIKGEETP